MSSSRHGMVEYWQIDVCNFCQAIKFTPGSRQYGNLKKILEKICHKAAESMAVHFFLCLNVRSLLTEMKYRITQQWEYKRGMKLGLVA